MVLLAARARSRGCGGDRTVVTEGPVTVDGSAAPTVPGGAEAGSPDMPGGARAVRIAVVTHGQASSPFWAIVRNGVEAAGRQMDAVISYRAPDVYSLEHMERLIDQAVATQARRARRLLPEPGLAPAIKRAVRAGIPTVTINSGSDMYKKLGVLAHVGQPEGDAGFKAGQRLAALGVAPRVVHQPADRQPGAGRALRAAWRARCARRAGGRRSSGSTTRPRARRKKIAAAVRKEHADGVLAMNSTSGVAAAKGLRGRVQASPIGTFDLGPDVLKAVKAGRIAFAVDQQAYLQGYLPVVLLAERARYGLFPAQGDVIPTGPNFVTRANAAKAIELSARSIR